MVNIRQKNQFLTVRMIKTFILIAGLSIFHFSTIRSVGFTEKTAFFDSASLFLLCFLFVNLIYTIQRYYHSNIALNTTNFSILALFTGLTIGAHYLISYSVFKENAAFIYFLNGSLLSKSILVLLVYLICLLLFWIDQQKIQERRLQDFAIEKERESMAIELNSLQQQFKPHFLFNSLNSINALTITNPEEARKMVHLLSEFMRAAVRENQSELVELEQEIHHIKLYTDIEKVRFGSRLSVNYELDEDVLALKLPSLILQPIIENAVKYGLYGHTEDVEISIKASKVDNFLSVSISNPYDKEQQSTVQGTGYGLQSIEKKMLILYNRANLLCVNSSDKLFTATLNIPQQ